MVVFTSQVFCLLAFPLLAICFCHKYGAHYKFSFMQSNLKRRKNKRLYFCPLKQKPSCKYNVMPTSDLDILPSELLKTSFVFI